MRVGVVTDGLSKGVHWVLIEMKPHQKTIRCPLNVSAAINDRQNADSLSLGHDHRTVSKQSTYKSYYLRTLSG